MERTDLGEKKGAGVPIISRFYGIAVYMYWKDHAPPHFHAKYQGEEVTVNITTGEVTGTMSRRAIAMVEEWRQLHQVELMDNWTRAVQMRTLNRIEPLE